VSSYQSIGSDVIEMTDVSEDAKYKKMDEFENTLYKDGAIPSGMNIRKRNILVFDSYAEASKQREEFIK
jgi:NADH:ubiquinone oxidoreductase subunit